MINQINPVPDLLSLPTPDQGSLFLQSNNMEWQACGEGFWAKLLYENKSAHQQTFLMKADAGAWSSSHSHEELEQIYILEGGFFDEENTYSAGDYIIRAPGSMHTAGSKNGAVMLVIYTK